MAGYFSISVLTSGFRPGTMGAGPVSKRRRRLEEGFFLPSFSGLLYLGLGFCAIIWIG